MKHTLLAVGILLLCIAFSVCSAVCVIRGCEQTSDALRQSLRAVEADDLEAAADCLHQADACWHRLEPFFGVVLRHEEADEVLTSLAELEQYVQIGDLDDYRAVCARLITAIGHLREMELPTVSNIL